MCDVPSGHLRYGMSPLTKRTSVVNHHESSINGPLLMGMGIMAGTSQKTWE